MPLGASCFLDAEADPSLLADLVDQGRVLVDRENRWAHLQKREPAMRHRGRRQDARDALASIDRLVSA